MYRCVPFSASWSGFFRVFPAVVVVGVVAIPGLSRATTLSVSGLSDSVELRYLIDGGLATTPIEVEADFSTFGAGDTVSASTEYFAQPFFDDSIGFEYYVRDSVLDITLSVDSVAVQVGAGEVVVGNTLTESYFGVQWNESRHGPESPAVTQFGIDGTWSLLQAGFVFVDLNFDAGIDGVSLFDAIPLLVEDGFAGTAFDAGFEEARASLLFFRPSTVQGNYEFVGVLNTIDLTPIPEPTTASLLALGLVALAAKRRRTNLGGE